MRVPVVTFSRSDEDLHAGPRLTRVAVSEAWTSTNQFLRGPSSFQRLLFRGRHSWGMSVPSDLAFGAFIGCTIGPPLESLTAGAVNTV